MGSSLRLTKSWLNTLIYDVEKTMMIEKNYVTLK